jgi:hypothetical protein
MSSKFDTREAWLEAAVVRLGRMFKEFNIEIPAVKVSVGWPSKGGLAKRNKVIGQCWKGSVSEDGVSQIFISPTHDNEIRVLATLVHELIHAWDDCESGHKGEFARVAKLVGLQGKMTATEVLVGTALWNTLDAIREDMGEWPHSALNTEEMDKQRPKQPTRMIKLVVRGCDCQYTVRTTQKHIDKGFPSCPCGVTMEQE